MEIPIEYAHKNESFLLIMKMNIENIRGYICDNLECSDCFLNCNKILDGDCEFANYNENTIYEAIITVLKELEDDTIKKR